MDSENTPGEDSKGKEEHIFWNEMKRGPCYIVMDNLLEWSPEVIWEAELMY